MLLHSKIFVVSPSGISEKGPCVLWPRQPSPELVESIRELGQLEPLLVRREKERIELVSGYSRLLALRELGRPAVCLEMSGSRQDGAVAYLRANCERTIDDSMRLVALRFLSDKVPQERLETEILPLLGIDVRAKSWRWWQDWLQLPLDFDDLVHEGHLPLAAVPSFAAFEREEQVYLLPWLRAVCWSRNNACNLLTWLYEAVRFHKTTLIDLLGESEFDALLQRDLSPKDMSAALLLEAKKLRYPNLSSLQEDLRNKLAPLVKGSLWQAEHEENFETSSLSLRCKIKNRAEAERARQELEKIAEYWEDTCD